MGAHLGTKGRTYDIYIYIYIYIHMYADSEITVTTRWGSIRLAPIICRRQETLRMRLYRFTQVITAAVHVRNLSETNEV